MRGDLVQNVSIERFRGSDGGSRFSRNVDQLQEGLADGEEVRFQLQVITGADISQALHISCGPIHTNLTSDYQVGTFSILPAVFFYIVPNFHIK